VRPDINLRPNWHSVALVRRSGMLSVSVSDRQDAGPTVYFHDLDKNLGRGAPACAPFLTAETNLGRHTGLPLHQSRSCLESVSFNAHQFREPKSACQLFTNSSARATTLSRLKPKRLSTSEPGAEAPKRSTPIVAP
jgi:hypothetical protein